MRLKRHQILLISIFVLVLAIRLYFAFQTPNFTNNAYFNLRQIEHIKETGLPLYEDNLSYGGRTYIFTPLFHYILAFFSLVLPLAFVAKLLPNIFAASLVFIIYLVSKEITKNTNAALFASFMAGFIPVFFSNTINSVSIFSLIIPLNFLVIYFFLKTRENKKNVVYMLALFFTLLLIHPASFILILGFLVYLLVVELENIGLEKWEVEVILFFTALIVWFNLVVYKNAFLVHGPNLIWRNIPPQIQSLYFSRTSIAEAIYQIGVVPFLCGVYLIYSYFYKYRKKNIHFIISFIIAAFVLLAFKLIEPILGLMFLGTFLVLLLSQFYMNFTFYIEKTRLSNLKKGIVIILIAVFVVTSIIPSISYASIEVKNSVTDSDISALAWIRENTPKNSIVLAPLEEGHLITTISRRKNVLDDNFLLIRDAKQRYEDTRIIYTTQYETNAVSLLNQYNVDYIYFSNGAKKAYAIPRMSYVNEKKCFELVYDRDVKIYKTLCRLEENK